MSESVSAQIEKLRTSISGLEAQRALLGDAIVEPALAALRQQLASLEGSSTPEAAASGPALDGERRLVTILFTDIVGSTSLAEKLDPEEWKEIVSEAHRIVAEAVYRYQGTIAQLLGDGVLAFFGAPVTHEDDPVRAVRASLDIRHAMADYARKLAGHVDNWNVRIGLNSGLVVTGNVGSDRHMEYLAVGDSVNLAARLQSAAQPGQVLISGKTHSSVGHAFYCTDLGEIQIKGKTEPVHVYQVESLKPQPQPARGVAGLQSLMVGRDAELGALRKAGKAVREGAGRVALIIGEPGLGKTRLIAEWKGAGGGPEQWAVGQCLSYGEGAAYHLVVEMLRSLLGITHTAGEAEANAALTHVASDLFGESAPQITLYLAHLLSLRLEGEERRHLAELDPQTQHAQYFAAIRRLVLALAARAPLALILEDVQWADASSTDLLINLLALITEAPILFCFTARPERDVPGWRLVSAARQMAEAYRLEIILRPLSQVESAELVSNLLEIESLREQDRRLILLKSEGNPFFVEQVVSMLIDQGILVKKDDAWMARGEIRDIDIPESLQALLLARIDRLVGELKRTLRVASVIGRQFSFKVLEYVFGELREGAQGIVLENYLGALGDSGLLWRLSSLPELEYLFRHALVQEAAYRATLKADRRILHRAVGQAIEMLLPQRLEEFSSMLAFHYERGEDWVRAMHWLAHAADRAFGRMALAEAMDLHRRALAVLQHLPPDPLTEFEQRYGLARCMMMTGAAREETLAEYERSLPLAPDAGRQAEVHFRIGELFHIYTSSDLDTAESHYARAIDLLGENRRTEQYCTATAYLGYLYRYRGQPERATETLERALRLANDLGSARIGARTLYFLSGAYLDLGREEEALSAGLRGLELAESLGNLELVGMAHSFLTDVYLQRAFEGEGAPDEALPHIDEMRRHGREYGVSPLAGFGAANFALYCELKGESEAALEAWKEGMRVWSAAGASRRAVYCCANCGRLLLEKGQTSAAERFFAQARELGGPENPALAELWIGLAYAGAGQEAQAVARLESAFSSELSAGRRGVWTEMIRTEPELAKQRSLPGVAALLERFQAMQA
jgi:class 3 adenylate cyclase/tetratricopeptide (TPR) repeat protein